MLKRVLLTDWVPLYLGSGKTLAYLIPLFQLLKKEEPLFRVDGSANDHTPMTPKAVILAPSRELVLQITKVIKAFAKYIKLSSTALLPGMTASQAQVLLKDHADILITLPSLFNHYIQSSKK